MNEILNKRQLEYNIVEKNIKQKRQQIENNLEKLKKQFSTIENDMKKQEEIYSQKSQNASSNYLEKLNKAHFYNKNLYSLEVKKYLSLVEEMQSQIKLDNLYLMRCQIFIDYLKATINKDAIEKNNKYYQLLNNLQLELVTKLKTESSYYYNKVDLSSNYVLFIKICVENNQGNVYNLSKHVLDPIEKIEADNMIKEYEKDIEEYKDLFRNNKFEINEFLLQGNTLMIYDIKNVIDIIYEKEKIGANEIYNR
ncbi:MAG: hypothetical protein PHN42_00530 [Bacilli bacterium]|nr:hypothetical protein [Bacilli bacterium]